MSADTGTDRAVTVDGVAGDPAAGAKVWSINVTSTVGSKGVDTWTIRGTVVEAGNDLLVRTQWGTYVPATDRWYSTEAEALEVGAAEIEGYGRRLLEQAAELRARAAVQREGL